MSLRASIWPDPLTALASALLLFAAVSAQSDDSGSKLEPGKWTYQPCLKLGGVLTIQSDSGEETVPENAHVCGFCDDSPLLILRWGADRYLLMFLSRFSPTDGGSETFQLDQIQYFEGEKGWHVDVRGFRGQAGGKVLCRHETSLRLEYDGPISAQGDDHGCAQTAQAAPGGGEDGTTPAGDEGKKGEDAPSGVQDAANPVMDQNTVHPESNRSAGAWKASKPDGTRKVDESESDVRVIVLSPFSIEYSADTINDVSRYDSGCRVEPDMTLTLAIPGAAAAAVLVTAAVIALRLFC